MSSGRPQKIISVTGACSSVGKTTLCSILLENLNGFGAIKFTRTKLYTSVIDDEDTLRQEGKDTAILLRSGAEKVVWVRSPGGPALESALLMSLQKMTGVRGIIIEGNSPLQFTEPNAVIFIMRADSQIKQSAHTAAGKAGIIIMNTEGRDSRPFPEVRYIRPDAKIFRIDVTKRTGEIDKFLEYIKQYIV